MTEYITKEQAKDPFYFLDKAEPKHEMDYPEWCDVIDELQAADVAPVVHGEWLTPKALIECSECGFGMFPDAYYFDHGECTHHNESWFRPKYCPHCGARMDGGKSK